MTSDTTAAPRANRLGHPCPPWCTTDHTRLLIADIGLYADHHGSAAISPAIYPYRMKARVSKNAYGDDARVVAEAGNGTLYVTLDHAGDLAELLDGLADASPEQIRALAADVRAAAALAGDQA